MEIISVVQADIEGGHVIATTLDGEPITIYAVVCAPDLELLTDIVPASFFESGQELHANAVGPDDDVEDKVLEVIDNINPGDAAVFMCADQNVLDAILNALAVGDEQA